MQVSLPDKLEPLFKPCRYKVMYGGRGGGKSHSVAKALLILGMSGKERILCAREFQASIADSVHKLLADQISLLGLESFYEIQKTAIYGKNGTEFLFAGLRHNVTSIKSMEGCTKVWVEEAQTVSKSSWDVLIPTIRKEGSEIWLTFNPDLEDDETYKRFVRNPPSNAWVQKINWSDNPWFPEVLRQEMEDLKGKDFDSYLHVWEGNCKQVLDGAVYAAEIRQATAENRITKVPYDQTKPVSTFWDLGWADNTSIWFVQQVGFEIRVIDYLQDSQKPIQHYQAEIQKRGYVYDQHWLPHDAQAKQLGSGRSIEEILRASGMNIRITPKLSVADGINAARTLFPQVWIDQEKCADGLQCLRHYRYDVDPDTRQFSKIPLHDWASHGADAWRYMAVGLREPKRVKKEKPQSAMNMFPQSGGWMGG